MKRANCKSNKGFTLVELLVAVTIFVIAVSVFLPVFNLVARSNNQNKILATANTIASAQFEKISSMDYEKIGNKNGGNPSGDVEQYPDPIEIDGIKYEIETRITWGSTVDPNKEINYMAYKNVRIIVSAVNPYSGETERVEKTYSIVAKEGGQSMPDKGNLRSVVKQADGVGHEFPVFSISCNGPESYTMPTDEAGQVLFGEIAKGTYNVYTTIPAGWTVAQGFSVTGSTVTIPGIEINEWKVRDVYFYMDKPENFCKLSVKLVDEDGNVLNAQGKMTITWEIDGTTINVIKDKGFPDGNIDQDFIGRLWPQGNYNIQINFPYMGGYLNYDMSMADDKPLIEGTSEEWTGNFDNIGQALSIVVPIKTGQNVRDAYSKIEAESFDSKSGTIKTENCSDSGGTENLTNISNNNYTIYEYVNFKDGKPCTFQARVSAQAESKVTVQILNQSGTVLTKGTLWISPTGSSYKTVSCVIKDQNITGICNVRLIFESGSKLKVNWFKFSKVLDGFNGSNIGGHWKTYGNNWAVNDGTLKQSNTGNNLRQAVLENAGLSPNSHYTIIGKVRIDSWPWLNNTRGAGLSLFSGNGNTGFSLTFYRGSFSKLLGLMNGSNVVDYNSYNFANNQWYWFMLSSNNIGQKIRIEGKVWENGSDEPNWMFTREADNTNLTGHPSLFTYGNCTASFDDISVINNDSTE
ncbi:MAG: carbohydrate-binding protein [Clostridiaceae bacterium]|nr:carbohydrate-binding protein [Clostridiaceae bacterium]